MKSGIYKIVNKINGKLYIGSSTDVYYRISRHRYALNHKQHDNQYLQNAWNKHGRNSFIFEILLFCSKEDLIQKEQQAIDFYQSTWKANGYNICSVAGNCLGIKRSEETKRKMRGNTNGKGGKGRKHTEETKKKISIAHTGRKSGGMLGKHFSEQTKAKMSIAKIGKISCWKGKHHTEETIQKMKESHKGHKKGMLGKHHTEETKKKISMNNGNRKSNLLLQYNLN